MAYFEGKGYAFSWDWHDTYQEANNKAFHVAKVMRMDLLQDIHDAVGKTLTEGTTEADFRRELEPKLKAKGWWGRQKVLAPSGEEQEVQLGSPWRLRTIYTNNLNTSLAAGRWQAFAANADKRPYLQFVCVLDSHTRPSHRILHGKIFHISDPIWKTMAPPLDWGCRCRLRALSADDVKERGLKISNSEGTLSKEDRLVSESTGEMKPVTVYTDPKSGKRVATGPGWDYNPGMTDYQVDTKPYDKDLVQAYEAEVKSEGLAARIPVKTNADIEKLLTQFDKENPGHFQQGFTSLDFTRSGRMMMGASQDGQILISTGTFSDGFKPDRELRSALGKIGRGEDLSFHEEYSLEALWHEIGHTRSKGWVPKAGRPTHVTQVMETLNQWVARNTYPEFLKILGGEAKHQEAILDNGLGYRTWIRNFREMLTLAGIDETAALGVLRPLSVESNWYALPQEVPAQLAGLMAKPELAEKLKRAMRHLDVSQTDAFKRIVGEILKEGV